MFSLLETEKLHNAKFRLFHEILLQQANNKKIRERFIVKVRKRLFRKTLIWGKIFICENYNILFKNKSAAKNIYN